MRRSIFIVMVLVFSAILQGQTVFRGRIIDADYHTPVPFAAVYLESTSHGTVADNMGEFTLSFPDSLHNGRLVIVSQGYTTQYIPADSLSVNGTTIALQPYRLDQRAQALLDSLGGGKGKLMLLLDKATRFVMNDWIPLGVPETNKFDFGRIQTFPTYNPIEGVRLRAGVASNSRLSSHFFLKGYVAYGFGDQQFKYRGETTWSFNRKAYHDDEFPKNNLNVLYEKDLYSPGEMHPRSPNNLLLITYRRSENEATYRNFAEVNHEREYKTGFAHTVWLRRARLVPQGLLHFENQVGDMLLVDDALHTAEVGMLLRYSPREAYVQQKRKRKPIEITSPVFFLSHTFGSYDYFGEVKPWHRSEISMQKRFLTGTAGRLDVVGEVTKIWNKVPFPLLVYPNQRLRHHIENNAFFLNRALEFMADEQATIRTTFVGNDLLLTKVPLLNRLQMRELISLRASWGRLSDKNDPALSSNLYNFPTTSYRYGSVPYVEGTLGITQILGLLRVEYVHRFTYRNHPDALLGKIRVDVTL